MPLHRWKSLGRKVLFKNPWWTYRLEQFELEDGKRGEYHCVHTEGASMVIPLLEDGRILMVKQYRYLGDRESLEFPCGGVKEGISYEGTAAMELAEEARSAAGHMTLLGEFNPYNGVTDEVCKVFLARDLRTAQSTPDTTEEFEEVRLTPDELDHKISLGEIWDGMTLAAWVLAKKHVR